MAFSSLIEGRLELCHFVLFSKRILLASLLFGLDVVKAFDDGIDIVAYILEAVESVDTHLCG